MNKKVAYYSGCSANYNQPEVGRAAILVLEKNGFRPVFPEQCCCGIPPIINGHLQSFFKQAEANVRSLFKAGCDIVTTCTSCSLAIKRDYPKWLKSPEAKTVAARTFDIMEFLCRLHSDKVLNTEFYPVSLNLAYHAPCHLKALGQEQVSNRLALLRLIPGISVKQIDRGCCGMAGTFGMKERNYTVSMSIGRALFEEMNLLSPDFVITDCPTCKIQIEHGTGLKVSNPILILKEAYGL